MNWVNRLIALAATLALWIVLVALAALPDRALMIARQALAALEQSLGRVQAMQPSWLPLVIRAGVIAVATLLALFFLLQELRRKRPQVVKLRVASGGTAAVTAQSVGRRLAWHLDQLADVIEATPVVRTRGSTLDVDLNLRTPPEVDVPMMTEEVMAVTREVIQAQMGLQLGKVQVNIEHAPYQPIL